MENQMARRHYSGLITATSDTLGPLGLERFSVSVAQDGSRTLHATSEIDNRSVSKDIVYSVDKHWRPIDSYVRLLKNGSLLGTGWYRFDKNIAELEAWNVQLGRISQYFQLDRALDTFGPHPLTADVWHLASFNHDSGERVQRVEHSMLSSLEQDGASGPMLHPFQFGIEYIGRESLQVKAGDFEVDKYEFRLEGSQMEDHPLEELWCIPDDYIFVKIRVGGYRATTYELVEFQES
jgi:hypothetical protein